MNNDLLDSFAIKLYLEAHKKYNIMKEDNVGILTKDFIKNHIKHENELENKILELEDTISSLKNSLKRYESFNGCVKLDDENLTIGFNILLHILRYAEVNMDSSGYDMVWDKRDYPAEPPRSYSLSINSLQLSEPEASFIINLIHSDHTRSLENFNNEFDKHWHETGRGSNSRWSSHYDAINAIGENIDIG